MAGSTMGSVLLVLVLVASVGSEGWLPCQPFLPHQVNQANFTSWLSPSCHCSSVALQVQQLPWSVHLTIMGKPFSLHPRENMMLINFDGTQDTCPVQGFPINKWTDIRFTRKDNIIQVEVLTEHKTFSILSRLSEVCSEAEVKVIEVTSARLSLECPGVCVGQEADQDTHLKHLKGNTHTFFLLPKNDCQISIVPKFENCSVESHQNFTEFSYTCQDLGLYMNVWNKVNIKYEEMDGIHGHSLVVNNRTMTKFTEDRATSDCHDLLEYVVTVEGSVLWSGEGCDDYLCVNKMRKEGVRNGCTVNTTTATTNPPPPPNRLSPIMAVQAEEKEFESTTNTTPPLPPSSSPQVKSRPFMSTAALVFLVIIAVIIVIVITRVIWRAVARRRQRRNDSVDYYTLRVEE